MFKMVGIGLLLMVSTATLASDALGDRLQKIHADIIQDYDNVAHLDAEQFLKLDQADLIIFDVREANEYAVSHIAGAAQIDPNAEPEDFIETHGESLKNKTVVFYCSVGRRSSALAARGNDLLKAHGAVGSYNLTGGIFHWHNVGKPITNAEKATTVIHPYNYYWGRLITDKKTISYTPQ